jgi:hypothetical protein
MAVQSPVLAQSSMYSGMVQELKTQRRSRGAHTANLRSGISGESTRVRLLGADIDGRVATQIAMDTSRIQV